MSIGQPDDPRKFRRPYKYDVTKDIPPPKTKWDRCQVCKMKITGKKWRVDEDKYVCTRCYNE